MKTRALGASDLRLSVLGMGCWQYGGGSYWGEQSQKDVDAVVHRALDMGINYFDTAEVYNDGNSEISLGIALEGRRSEAIIGSKVSTANARPADMKKHCEASLRRLQTDYIDVYMLHWPMTPLAVKHFTDDAGLIANLPSVTEVFEALNRLKQEGKILHIGISNHGIHQMEEVRATGVPVVTNELAYNLLSRAIEDDIIPYCAQHQIGIIGYMPLLQGLLTGKFASLDEIRPMQARSRHFHYSRGQGTRHGEEGAEQEINTALLQIAAVAKQLGIGVGTLSLAWAIANEHICSTIVGSRNLEQLVMNSTGAAYELSSDVLEQLHEITEPVWKKLGSNPDYYENRNNSRIT